MHCNDVDEGLFLCEKLGCTVFRSSIWDPGTRNDIISYSNEKFKNELKALKIGEHVHADTRAYIKKLVLTFWDIFAKIGLKRTMHGFEYAIDTGKHTPVCCKKTPLRTT